MKIKPTLLCVLLFALSCYNSVAQQTASDTVQLAPEMALLPGKRALQLISLDSTKQAIQVLLDANFRKGDEVLLLQSRFNKSNQDFRLGIIDFETWDIEQNRINYALMNFIPDEPQKGKADSRELNRLIAAGDTKSALKLLVDTNDETAILIQARYLRAEGQRMQGTIDVNTFNRLTANIRNAIVELYSN